MKQWRQHAACRDFPLDRIEEVWYAGRDDYAEARTVCRGCPVVVQCADAANPNRGGRIEQWGMWGGLSPSQRGVKDGEPTVKHDTCGYDQCGATLIDVHHNRRYCDDTCKDASSLLVDKRTLRQQRNQGAA